MIATNVLVLCARNSPGFPPVFVELADAFIAVAERALQRLGATVETVDVNVRPIPPTSELLGRVDGVVVLGGGDVDPELYGVPQPVPNQYGVDRVADVALLDLVRAALAEDIPYLGICRGSQLLNVALGGSLIPDIENWQSHRGGTPESVFIEETIDLDDGSLLADVLGSRIRVKNGHHQAVERLGTDLKCVGRAGDGVIEAIEHQSRWAVGVQWHPEHPDAHPAPLSRLLGAFLDVSAARALERERAS